MPLSLFKSCLKPELVNRLNHDAQIVAQHLAKRLIDLRRERDYASVDQTYSSA